MEGHELDELLENQQPLRIDTVPCSHQVHFANEASLEELTPSSHSSFSMERSNLQVQSLRNQKAHQDVERIAAKLAQAGNLTSHNSKKQTNSLRNLISISNKKRMVSPKLNGIKSNEIYGNPGHKQRNAHMAA